MVLPFLLPEKADTDFFGYSSSVANQNNFRFVLTNVRKSVIVQVKTKFAGSQLVRNLSVVTTLTVPYV